MRTAHHACWAGGWPQPIPKTTVEAEVGAVVEAGAEIMAQVAMEDAARARAGAKVAMADRPSCLLGGRMADATHAPGGATAAQDLRAMALVGVTAQAGPDGDRCPRAQARSISRIAFD